MATNQSRAGSPITMAAVDAVLASTQEPAATDTVRHGDSAGSPVDGSMRWWTRSPPNVQFLRPMPELASPPDVTDTATAASSAPLMSAIPTVNPPSGAPLTDRSPPRETRTPHPKAEATALRRTVGSPRLRRGAKIDKHPGRCGDGARLAVERDGLPAGEGLWLGQTPIHAGRDHREVPVVSEPDQSGTNGDVHGTVGKGAGAQTDPDGFGQQRRDRNRTTVGAGDRTVQDAELRVRAEPTGHGLHHIELTMQQIDRADQCRRLGDDEVDAGGPSGGAVERRPRWPGEVCCRCAQLEPLITGAVRCVGWGAADGAVRPPDAAPEDVPVAAGPGPDPVVEPASPGAAVAVGLPAAGVGDTPADGAEPVEATGGDECPGRAWLK